MPPLLMTMREVSDLTGIPVETLRTWRRRRLGQGPAALTVEGRVLYRRTDVMSWIASLAPISTGTEG